MKNFTIFFKFARGIIITVPLLGFLFLANEYFAISGKLSFTYDFHKTPNFAGAFYPTGRATEPLQSLRTGIITQTIAEDPVYMDVRVPRSYDRVDVAIEYVNHGQPFAEFGLLTYTQPFGIALFPFESALLEQAQTQFHILRGTDPKTNKPVVLYQRENIISSVAEFFAKPPANDRRIITYDVDVPVFYRPKEGEYTARTDSWTLPLALRGQHVVNVYVHNESLVFDAIALDLNREIGPDILTVVVKNEKEEEVLRAVVPDDGNTGADRHQSAEYPLHIALPQLPEGVYTVSFFATRDIVLANISTQQQKFVFENSITTISDEELHDHDATIASPPLPLPLNFVMGSSFFRATPTTTFALQPAVIDNVSLPMTAVNTAVAWHAADDYTAEHLHTLSMPAGDVKLETQGFFATAPEHFFDPRKGLRELSDQTELRDCDIIIAQDFVLPQTRLNRNIRIQTVHMDLTQTAIDRKKITFVFSSPGIATRDADFEIRKIHFTFTRQPLWQRLRAR